MRNLVNRIIPKFQSTITAPNNPRCPHFERREGAGRVDLAVFVPGVTPASVDLVVDDRDLVVTARKSMPVRPNWQAANFEAVQGDYHLRIQLGQTIDWRRLRAVLRDGILKIQAPRLAKCSPRGLPAT